MVWVSFFAPLENGAIFAQKMSFFGKNHLAVLWVIRAKVTHVIQSDPYPPPPNSDSNSGHFRGDNLLKPTPERDPPPPPGSGDGLVELCPPSGRESLSNYKIRGIRFVLHCYVTRHLG